MAARAGSPLPPPDGPAPPLPATPTMHPSASRSSSIATPTVTEAGTDAAFLVRRTSTGMLASPRPRTQKDHIFSAPRSNSGFAEIIKDSDGLHSFARVHTTAVPQLCVRSLSGGRAGAAAAAARAPPLAAPPPLGVLPETTRAPPRPPLPPLSAPGNCGAPVPTAPRLHRRAGRAAPGRGLRRRTPSSGRRKRHSTETMKGEWGPAAQPDTKTIAIITSGGDAPGSCALQPGAHGSWTSQPVRCRHERGGPRHGGDGAREACHRLLRPACAPPRPS